MVVTVFGDRVETVSELTNGPPFHNDDGSLKGYHLVAEGADNYST